MNEIIDEMIQELDLLGYRVARTDIKKFISSLKYQLKYDINIKNLSVKKLIKIYLNKNKNSRGSI